jgi:hypothetical protein
VKQEISKKKFLFILSIFVSLFLLFHLYIWYTQTKNIFGREDGSYVGDLSRIAYQTDILHPRKNLSDLPIKHFNLSNWNGERIDIITIGDSFSNADVGGKNPYYQDYLASEYGLNVLNIQSIESRSKYMETILILLNNGTLEKLKPKVVLIESVVRQSLGRFSTHINFDIVQDLKLQTLLKKRRETTYIPNLYPINTANYKYINAKFKELKGKRPNKNVHKYILTKNLFSQGNTLLFHDEDTHLLEHITKEKMQLLNNNFNKLAKKLDSLNIKLFFMPAVDKYDLYEPYIVKNPYKKNQFFPILRSLQKDYYLVDTKEILSKLVQKDEKDVYYIDDTHWSYKASEAIVKDKVFNDNL